MEAEMPCVACGCYSGRTTGKWGNAAVGGAALTS